jgi:chemotaxis protein methyltransferase CheR
MTLESGPRPITTREFTLFQALIRDEAGISLAAHKEALVAGRLSRRLRALGLTSYGEYYRRITELGDREERVRAVEALCTHETHWFREPRHWELLRDTVIPRWKAEAEAGRRPRRVTAWSAACSSGEEPYSLAMLLLDQLPGWELEIIATDLSTQVLERARTGIYSLERSSEIPAPYLKRYMLRGSGAQDGRMAAGPEIRAPVRFSQMNLNDGKYAVQGSFDLVFCRNVLIYFSREDRAAVVDRLLDRLAPGGLLLLGHAESLNHVTTRVRAVIPTVYALASAAPAHV